MAKLYAKKNVAVQNLKPKKETISFLLNYSKALRVYTLGKTNFEIIAN
jgi:hypothetical protein